MNLKVKIVFLLLCIFVMNGCKEKTESMNLSEEQMIDILVDIHVAEAALQNYYGEEKDSLATLYYKQIFQMHETEEKDFSQSLKVLRTDPSKIKEVYSMVVETINKDEASGSSK